MLAALACLISCSLAKAFTQPTEKKGGRGGTKEGEGSAVKTHRKGDMKLGKVLCICGVFLH